MLSAAADADAMATTMQGAPTGELKISAPLTFGLRFVSPALASFLKEYPDVSARLEFDDRRVELVSEGFDVAIRIGELPDSSLKARKLAETDMNIVMNEAGRFVEVQGTAEGHAFTTDEFNAMLGLARDGIAEIVRLQAAALDS